MFQWPPQGGGGKGCLMGVSSRATRVIEPTAADLLMPDRIRRASAPRMRDVEDACFETLGNPRDVFAPKARGADQGGVFKSRIGQSPSHGPFPRDYASLDQAAGTSAEPRERLGVFAKNARGLAVRTSGLSPAACGFAGPHPRYLRDRDLGFAFNLPTGSPSDHRRRNSARMSSASPGFGSSKAKREPSVSRNSSRQSRPS